MEPVIVFGAGGHALSVLDILQTERRYHVTYIADKNPVKDANFWGIPVIEENEVQLSLVKKAIVAIGDNHIRKSVSEKLTEAGFQLVNAVSPYSYVSEKAKLGNGIVIMPFAVIGPGTSVADGVIVNTKASIDHDCRIEKYSHIAPGSTICGFVDIGEKTFFCAGATVKDSVQIGNNCVVGAGAVVVKNVPDNCNVMGVPAKSRKEDVNA